MKKKRERNKTDWTIQYQTKELLFIKNVIILERKQNKEEVRRLLLIS